MKKDPAAWSYLFIYLVIQLVCLLVSEFAFVGHSGGKNMNKK